MLPGQSDFKIIQEQNEQIRSQLEQLTRKVNRYILMSQIWSWIKVILIVGPLIVAYIYLPPLVKQFFDMYKNIAPVPVENLDNTMRLLR